MLFWHLGSITFLFRWIFRDPKVDMRFLAAGVVLPDLIDLGVATIVGSSASQFWGHSLVVPSLVGIVVLAATRRGRRRRGWMALVVAWLLHLLIDRMWLDATVFLWPVFGWDLIGETGPWFWSNAWARASDDPWRWVLEVIGLGYLMWLAYASGLTQSRARAKLMESGRLGNRPNRG